MNLSDKGTIGYDHDDATICVYKVSMGFFLFQKRQ